MRTRLVVWGLVSYRISLDAHHICPFKLPQYLRTFSPCFSRPVWPDHLRLFTSSSVIPFLRLAQRKNERYLQNIRMEAVPRGLCHRAEKSLWRILRKDSFSKSILMLWSRISEKKSLWKMGPQEASRPVPERSRVARYYMWMRVPPTADRHKKQINQNIVKLFTNYKIILIEIA